MNPWLISIGVGVVLGLPLTAAARWLAWRVGQLDRPGGHKRHVRPVPVAGGVAVLWTVTLPFVAAVVLAGGSPDPPSPALTMLGGQSGELLTLLGGALLLHLVGLVDDRHGLSPLPKLAAQALAALPVVLLFDVRLLPLWLPPVPSVALTLLWFLTVTNAFNFLDGLDGLLGSVGTVCALLLGVTAVATAQSSVAVLLGLLAGALLGFLVFNRPPASIFMGDSGSLVVGFLLAYASIEITYAPPGSVEEAPWYAVFTPLVVLAIPLYDLVTVVCLRLWQLKSPTEPDTQHFSHRLKRRGMRDGKVVVVVCACTVATGLGGVMLIHLEAWQAILVAAQTVTVLSVLALLESAPDREDLDAPPTR